MKPPITRDAILFTFNYNYQNAVRASRHHANVLLQYGNKAFVKLLRRHTRLYKAVISWERVMNFEDGSVCCITKISGPCRKRLNLNIKCILIT